MCVCRPHDKRMIRVRYLAALLIIAAAATFGVAVRINAPPSGEAAGPGPGMNIVCPAAVQTGTPFTCRIVTDPSPADPLAGYKTEVALPFTGEIQYENRPCRSEVSVTHSGGQPVSLCEKNVDYSTIVHSVGNHFTDGLTLDLPASDSGSVLVELTLTCYSSGTFTVALRTLAESDLGSGSAYYDQYGKDLGAKVESTTVECAGQAVATPTPTPNPAGNPGMSISIPAIVQTGETFAVSIRADPAPSVPIAGYATELVLPPALSWQQRPTCRYEIGATVDGHEPAVCIRAAGPFGQPRHVVSSAVQQPPLPALALPQGELVTLDIRCDAPGTHRVALMGIRTSAFGAIYFDMNSDVVGPRTQRIDLDGDTVPEHVVDVIQIECIGPTATPCASPCATPAPCFSNCPTRTPSGQCIASCPPTATPEPPPLAIEATCAPGETSVDEHALLTCSVAIENVSGESIDSASLSIGLAVGQPHFDVFDVSVEGVPVPVRYRWQQAPLPTIEPGETISVTTRIIVVPHRGVGEYRLGFTTYFDDSWSGSDEVVFDATDGAAYPPTNLSIQKRFLTPLPSEPPVPSEAEYEIVVANVSAAPVDDVQVFDKHFGGVQVVATDPPALSINEGLGIGSWSIGDLAPGEEGRIVVRVVPSPGVSCANASGPLLVTGRLDGMEEAYSLRAEEYFSIGQGPNACLAEIASDGDSDAGSDPDRSSGGPAPEGAAAPESGTQDEEGSQSQPSNDADSVHGSGEGATVSAPDAGSGAPPSRGIPIVVVAMALILVGVLTATLTLWRSRS